MSPALRIGESWIARAVAFGVVAACLLYGHHTFLLSFNTNDDVAMQGIARGVLGSELGEARLVYQSGWIGLVVGNLLRLYEGFDWYSAFQWALLLASFLTTTTVMLRRSLAPLNVLVTLALGSIFYAPALFHLQFTQTSLFCAAAAAVLLVDDFDSERFFSRSKGLALFFALMASLLRPVNSIAAQIALLGAAGFVLGWLLLAGERGRAAKKFATSLAFIGLFALLSNGIKSIEGSTFYGEPGWDGFWRHHADRAYVLENWPRWVGQEKIAAELDRQLGITAEQYMAMVHWLPIERDLYAPEAFGEMAKVVRAIDPGGGMSLARVRSSVPQQWQRMSGTPILRQTVAFILVLALLTAFQHPDRRMWMLLTGIYWSAFLFSVLLVIELNYRSPPYRVFMPLAALASLCAAQSLSVVGARVGRQPQLRPARWISFAALPLAFLLCLLWVAPLHRTFRGVADSYAKKRTISCAKANYYVEAFERVPEPGRIYLAPRTVDSDCFVRPFDFAYPTVLRERTTAFGWRNLTPWIRDELFASHERLFDVICSDPRNAFVLAPKYLPDVSRYLARHEPGIQLEPYGDDMPDRIYRCRRSVPGPPPERRRELAVRGDSTAEAFPIRIDTTDEQPALLIEELREFFRAFR